MGIPYLRCLFKSYHKKQPNLPYFGAGTGLPPPTQAPFSRESRASVAPYMVVASLFRKKVIGQVIRMFSTGKQTGKGVGVSENRGVGGAGDESIVFIMDGRCVIR